MGIKYAIYKSASAVSLELGEDGILMLKAAEGQATVGYDWKNAIIMKLGLSDIGTMLTFVNRRATQVKLYHDPNKGRENEGQIGKTLSLWVKDGKKYISVRMKKPDGEKKVAMGLTDAELEILRVALELATKEALAANYSVMMERIRNSTNSPSKPVETSESQKEPESKSDIPANYWDPLEEVEE